MCTSTQHLWPNSHKCCVGVLTTVLTAIVTYYIFT